MAGILSNVKPWDIVAEGYVEEVKPLFELWANDSFERMNPQSDHRVIDVACGPGTVSLLLADKVKEIESYDFSENMLEVFRKSISEQSISNILTHHCDCQELTAEDNQFDQAYSQFGLMFFPDRIKGFSEIYRVLKPGGKAAVYSWAPHSESNSMGLMMETLYAGFPEIRPEDDGSAESLSSLDNRDVFIEEMQRVGFKDVTVEAVRHNFPYASPEEFWKSIVKGSAPITMMKANTEPDVWLLKEKLCIEYLEENMGDQELYSTALLGIGTK